MADVIIGAGVIGLHTAYYLTKQGRDVIIIDKTQADNNCSFGNAGYISPSHFIPLATPGIVWQGLKWMLDSQSPFYIKPRFNKNLITWGWFFWKSANQSLVNKNAPFLYQLLKLSRELSMDIHDELGHSFDLWKEGCLMLYADKTTGKHEEILAGQAKKEYGLDVLVLDNAALRHVDPLISDKVLGGAFYKIDCHLHPGQMMNKLRDHLVSKGVQFRLSEEVTSFGTHGSKVTKVITNHGDIHVENLIIAAGSWSSRVAEFLGINMPLQAGKGYSYTYKDPEKNIQLPSILVDHRVAMTPFANELRLGGTMELGGLNLQISPQRIPPIVKAANLYFNDLHLSVPPADRVWAGLRPVSPDGMPYIGRDKTYQNVLVGSGHAMIGISSAAATGYLLSQIIQGRNPEIPLDAFRVNRF